MKCSRDWSHDAASTSLLKLSLSKAVLPLLSIDVVSYVRHDSSKPALGGMNLHVVLLVVGFCAGCALSNEPY